MPVELIYLVVLLITICIFFIVLKRPIYEGMLAGYIVMVAMTGQWGHIWDHVYATSTNTLFYAIVAFMVVAQIFTGTKVIDSCIEVVLSIFGRIKGGTGYVALLVSSFMGALSGSAAGMLLRPAFYDSRDEAQRLPRLPRPPISAWLPVRWGI